MEDSNSRSSWVERANEENVRIAEQALSSINSAVKHNYELKYNKAFIGLSEGEKPYNFVTFAPQKKECNLSVRVPQTDEMDALLESNSFSYGWKNDWYQIKLNTENISFIDQLAPMFADAEAGLRKDSQSATIQKEEKTTVTEVATEPVVKSSLGKTEEVAAVANKEAVKEEKIAPAETAPKETESAAAKEKTVDDIKSDLLKKAKDLEWEIAKDDIVRACRVALECEDCEDAFIKIGNHLMGRESALSMFFYEHALDPYYVSERVDRNSIRYEDLLKIAICYRKVVEYLTGRAKEIFLHIASKSNDNLQSQKSAYEFLHLSSGDEDCEGDSEVVRDIMNDVLTGDCDCEDKNVLFSLFYYFRHGNGSKFQRDDRKAKVLLQKILSKNDEGKFKLDSSSEEWLKELDSAIDIEDLNVIVGKDENLWDAVHRTLPKNSTDGSIWRLTISGELTTEDLFYIFKLSTYGLWYLDIRNATMNKINKMYMVPDLLRGVRYVVVPIATATYEFWLDWKNDRLIIPKEVNDINPMYFLGCGSVAEVEVEWATPLIPRQKIADINGRQIDVIIPKGTKQLYEKAGWSDMIEKQNEFD